MDAEQDTAPSLSEAETSYLSSLAAALQAIEELPLVTSATLQGKPKDKLNAIRVRANLKVAFVTDPKKSSQPQICCSKDAPTQLECAKQLLKKLHDEYKDELAAAAAVEPTAGTSSSPRPPTAFDRMKAAAVAHKTLQKALAEEETEVRDALAPDTHPQHPPSTPNPVTCRVTTRSQEELSPLFHSEATRDAETNAYIVDRVKAALDVNKACATEEQRREYLIGLAYVAPPEHEAPPMDPKQRLRLERDLDLDTRKVCEAT